MRASSIRSPTAAFRPSNFGMEGTEDLGGGLKAEFKLESGINMGQAAITIRTATSSAVRPMSGLKDGFGEVKAGLQFSPFFLALYDNDPRGLAQTGGSLMMYLDNVVATGIFTPNAVSYTSPVLWGFQGSVLYSFGGVAGNFQDGRQYSASLKYDNGLWRSMLHSLTPTPTRRARRLLRYRPAGIRRTSAGRVVQDRQAHREGVVCQLQVRRRVE